MLAMFNLKSLHHIIIYSKIAYCLKCMPKLKSVYKYVISEIVFFLCNHWKCCGLRLQAIFWPLRDLATKLIFWTYRWPTSVWCIIFLHLFKVESSAFSTTTSFGLLNRRPSNLVVFVLILMLVISVKPLVRVFKKPSDLFIDSFYGSFYNSFLSR